MGSRPGFQNDRAVADYNAAICINPNTAFFELNRGTLLLRLNRGTLLAMTSGSGTRAVALF